jgi:protein-S-isoprenylcysteine O-methyltransferase Ste14
MAMVNEERDENVVLEHPNRKKASSKATKAIVILLLLVSVGLMLIVALGGWNALEGAKAILIAYMAIYLIMAFYCARWNRGVLPLAAAFGIILLIFAVIAGPEWFARDKTGFSNPTLDEGILGLITLLLVPVQLLLIAFAMRGFQQDWHVEVEHPADERRRYDEDDDPGRAPARA